MFKRLRERIVEEATKFPSGQANNSTGKPLTESEIKKLHGNSSEDLITLSESSSSVVVPQTTQQQFSIGEEDESVSPIKVPQKRLNEASNGSSSDHIHATNRDGSSSAVSDHGYMPEYRPTKSNYIPQSDIESEREDPPTLNLEGISKDQLLSIIDMLKGRSQKYKNKYAEVVIKFKDLRDEKLKIEHLLIEHQDKSVRRMAELREQCQLEQKAKAHLEAELQLQIEEKDSRISVMETQISLLKEADKSSSLLVVDDNISQNSASFEIGDSEKSSSNSDSTESTERLEHQLNQAKKTIKSQTDQILVLKKQNEVISSELEVKIKQLNEMEDKEANLKSHHEFILASVQSRLKELESEQEESAMSMAETKKNMHEELELKDKLLAKAKEDIKNLQLQYESEKSKRCDSLKQHEDKIARLQQQLESTEKMLEEEKENLMQELARGKTAAINLMQQECAKKIVTVEEEWKDKFEDAQAKMTNIHQIQVDELSKKLLLSEEKLKNFELKINEMTALYLHNEKETVELKTTYKNKESVKLESQLKDITCIKDKLENAEKNHQTQINELKSKLEQLGKEKSALESEKAELLKMQEQMDHIKNAESVVKAQCKSKDEELKKLQQKYEVTHKEQVEKIHNYQEMMKDKENMILKLQASLESLKKESQGRNDELKKKIKLLEEEQEQLMIQAQERVSTTEAKCREDLKSLQEHNNKLEAQKSEIENLKSKCASLTKELSAAHSLTESQQSKSKKEISRLEDLFSSVKEKLLLSEENRQTLETKVKQLEDENSLLLGKSNHFESLKAEKEELNEKLKQVEHQVTSIKDLEKERNSLKAENATILEKLELLQSGDPSQQQNVSSLEANLSKHQEDIKHLTQTNQNLSSELVTLRNQLSMENNKFVLEKEALVQKISLLEKAECPDLANTALKDYIEVVRGEYESAIKAKDEDLESKLKLLVRDFCEQMDLKDKDCDKMVSEIIEKSQETESKLLREHRTEITELRQDLFQKECALEDMRDTYEESLKEKEKKIKELQHTLKKANESNGASNDSVFTSTEGSDWDDTWVVPDECAENTSPIHSSVSCKEHLHEINFLKEELSKSNSEIKELKILLRLSPPESMLENNNCKDSTQSLPEPTEFEYLKNIIYEYMMGKEPITLVKVIAAVLRFSDTQTQQVIRREEAKHPMR